MSTTAIRETTQERHKIIFETYETVLEELGVQATNVSKKSLYDEVARRTNYTSSYISKIITKKFSNNGPRSK